MDKTDIRYLVYILGVFLWKHTYFFLFNLCLIILLMDLEILYHNISLNYVYILHLGIFEAKEI